MSAECHVCGPVKHEAPTVLCAECVVRLGDPEIEIVTDPESGRSIVTMTWKSKSS